jgi:O-antigen ligase
VVQLVRTRPTLFAVVRALMLAGAVAGAVGAVLWALPTATQQRLLNALGLFGYPTGDVLRFVPGDNDTYTTQLRAIGTAVDPNAFGGTLVMALALMAVQWSARDRLFSRPVLLLLALPTLAGVVLSFSRGSWVGLAAAVLLFGAARYRTLWVALAAIGLVALPGGRDVIARFTGGFSSADPATALRFGEFHNALTLITRYPWLGIGFGASPDSDVTAGVSSVYLQVAEQTGIVGIVLFLGAIASVVLAGMAGLRRTDLDDRTRGVVGGLLAALTAALVAGAVDHYFADMNFLHAVALFWLYAALIVSAARLPALTSSAPTRTGPPAARR